VDDIALPPPREAKGWYCSECGELGGEPDPSYTRMDRRYAVGTHHCTKPRMGKGGRVHLIADFYFDRADWEKQVLNTRMRKAFEAENRGTKLKPEEHALAARYRVKIGLITNEDARGRG
jgi:hypothetical protein